MKIILCLAALIFSSSAAAEVMDKEFSVEIILIFTLLCSAILFFTARFRPIFLVLIVPVVGTLCLSQIQEANNPFVGPAILAEAGKLYIVVSWAAPVVCFASSAAGIICRYTAMKRLTN